MNSNPSDLTASDAFGRVRIVLVRPSHPGNIGAAARAMKTMGFGRLVLVAPKVFPAPEAEAMASGAVDVLAAVQVVDSLPAALEGVTLALALTSRRRDLATAPCWAREGAVELAQQAVAAAEVALVFGNETTGLSNEEFAYCNRWAMIPANPAYSSLNLAAAVQVLCYELRLAIATSAGAVAPAPSFTPARMLATHEEIEGLLAQIEGMAIKSGFLDPERPGRLMLRLRRLFARAGLEREEVNILRGLLTSCRQPTGKRYRESA
ncbi:RNA methyltransferase [Sulfuricystis multivorans]|uniref:RNA methyltransferase n=1 Tax=Sulfuricystis multivorans TaxID=2211108 RepID=UPI000F8351CE|nr:RNA methyltransferase [Sulfuricystis multivorans]